MTEAQKRANINWRKRNREKIAEKRRERYASDEDYRERCKASSRKYYNSLDDEAKSKIQDDARLRYSTDTEYRDKMRKKSLDWYYKNKAKENENV